jgi:hypothetical protein
MATHLPRAMRSRLSASGYGLRQYFVSGDRARLDAVRGAQAGLTHPDERFILDAPAPDCVPTAQSSREPQRQLSRLIKCSCVKDQRCSALQVIELLQQTLELLRIIFTCKMMARER